MYYEDAPLTMMYDVIQPIQSMVMSLLVQNMAFVCPIPLMLNRSDHPLDMENVDSIIQVVENARSSHIIVPINFDEHYLILLFNKANVTYTIYDPSYDQTNAHGLLNTVTDLLTERSGYMYTLIPYFMDFQHRTDDFYCSLWSMMVMVVSIANRYAPSKVVATLNTYDRDTLTRVIGGFIISTYNTLLDYDLETLSYNAIMFMSVRDVPLTTIYSQLDVYSYLQSQGWVIRDVPVRHLKILYARSIDTYLTPIIRRLQSPMSESTFMDITDMIYLSEHNDIPRSWDLAMLMDATFTSTYDLLETIKPISRMIAGGNIPTDKDLEEVRRIFSYTYDVDIDSEYKIWSFIFEFYVRYLLLDTYDIPGCRTIMDSREKKYNDLMNRYNISSTSVFFLCMFPPAHYVDLEKFLKTVSTNTNSKEHIIDSFLQSCLQRSERLDRTHRKRLEAILSAI